MDRVARNHDVSWPTANHNVIACLDHAILILPRCPRFFSHTGGIFFSHMVVMQSLRGKNLQLEWVGSHFSTNRLASYFQNSQQLAGCFMLCFWKTETYRRLPHKAAMYFISFEKHIFCLCTLRKAWSVSCPCSLKLEHAKYHECFVIINCMMQDANSMARLIEVLSIIRQSQKFGNHKRKKLAQAVFYIAFSIWI